MGDKFVRQRSNRVYLEHAKFKMLMRDPCGISNVHQCGVQTNVQAEKSKLGGIALSTYKGKE